MTGHELSRRINRLFQQNDWRAARTFLNQALSKQPNDHWSLTQLGVTHYEQRRYAKAYEYFRQALAIKPDCPLALWNVAGTLDALGRPADAIPIFRWLVGSTRSPDDDPCWESEAWSVTLKADCVYRIGVCYENLGDAPKALGWFRSYGELRLLGAGTYELEEVAADIRRAMSAPAKANGIDRIDEAIRAALGKSVNLKSRAKRNGLPPLPALPATAGSGA